MERIKEIKKAIINTIVYFNIFDYPITRMELCKWLISDEPIDNHSEADQALEILITKKVIMERHGFYFLPKSETINISQNLIDLRQERYTLSLHKFRQARRYLKLLAMLPFIRMIGVSNTLSYNNVHNDSDIDLFIIAQPNKLWTARFFAVGITALLRLRPTEKTTKNKFCFNFFISAEKLDLTAIALKNSEINDIHLAFLLSQIVPIYDEHNLASEILVSNSWIKKFFPNVFSYHSSAIRTVKLGRFSRLFKKTAEILLTSVLGERVFKKYQLRILPAVLKAAMNQNTNVVINDQILKFHLNDRREYYNNLFFTQASAAWEDYEKNHLSD